ncbi:MAG: hypothetical protein KGJ60_10715 [Verrucomicrobiota bacterium]|nr:hypothetical protein [Verrucomicrobiota bacterium]
MRRSAVYHLLNTIAPINHAAKARMDAAGSGIIVGLWCVVVLLMRLILSRVQ